MPATVQGVCPPRFDAVRALFQQNLDAGLEQGVRFALALEGELVVDL